MSDPFNLYQFLYGSATVLVPVVECAPDDPAESVEDVADHPDHGKVVVVVDKRQPERLAERS